MSKKYDPDVAIKQQQKSLDLAIKQNEGNKDIQDSLRKQKAELGNYLKPLKSVQKESVDGGNVRRSQLVNAGNKAEQLKKNAINVTVIKKDKDINQ